MGSKAMEMLEHGGGRQVDGSKQEVAEKTTTRSFSGGLDGKPNSNRS